MKRTRKVRIFTALGVLVAIFSLFSCISVFGASYANAGVALEAKEIFDIQFTEISDFYFEEDTFEVKKAPYVDDKNNIIFGILLKEPEKYSQFQFNIENKGNINVKVSKIEVLGFEDYSEFVDIKVIGIEKNDILDYRASVPVKVVITYKSPFLDEAFISKNIELCNIKINIEFSKE